MAGLARLPGGRRAALGDEEVAALVYPELEPFAGGTSMVGHLVSCYGAADRYLGMLAAMLGEGERRGAALRARARAQPAHGRDTWVAHTPYEYGRFLLARAGRRPAARRRAAGGGRRARGSDRDAGAAGAGPRTRAAAHGAGLPDGLSPREVQILALVARGLSNREVGSELSISEHTAANHMRSILRKTGCANRTEAASYAHRHAA